MFPKLALMGPQPGSYFEDTPLLGGYPLMNIPTRKENRYFAYSLRVGGIYTYTQYVRSVGLLRIRCKNPPFIGS
jgi:hypothetical protein